MTSGKKRTSQGLADPNLLDKIDKLFACNVGEYVDLPQLVVVGDQSSGKSSVLEGLTDLPFPRDSSLCTRFATQITFRRDETKKIDVSIIPGPGASNEHADAVRKFVKVDLQNLDAASFAEIMREVQVTMGVSGPGEEIGQGTTFTDDVLRLEISGPDEEHLTVIDVPGIFRNLTENVTTKADRDLVRNMVTGYMANPRSLMLAVVPANVDIATQEILDMAQELDPLGHRTLGVLTKVDLVDRGAHKPVIELLQGKRHRLSLGWHIVRNSSQEELDSANAAANRHQIEEAFFKTQAPWNTIDKDKVGVPALRAQLQVVLAGHIRREFPKVKSEISKKLKGCKEALEGLGAERESSAEQSQYLLKMAMEFQRLVAVAVDARYGGDEVFESKPLLCLATDIVKRNEQFSEVVGTTGHTYYFDQGSSDKPATETENEDSEDDESKQRSVSNGHVHSDLHDMVEVPNLIAVPNSGNVFIWLTGVYQKSRGFELGTFDSSLLAMTMRKQSVKWDALANGYIVDVASIVHNFIHHMLEQICPDEHIRAGLLALLNDKLMERYKKAFTQVDFVLDVERAGTPTTLNHYFNDNLEKCRQARMQEESKKYSYLDTIRNEEVVRVSDIAKNHPMSNTAHLVQDIHDILKSYYKVARKRFVDNICMMAADYHLVRGPNTPLKLFSPTFVASMTTEQLEDVAGEDALLKRKRASLMKEIKDLETGRKILN